MDGDRVHRIRTRLDDAADDDDEILKTSDDPYLPIDKLSAAI